MCSAKELTLLFLYSFLPRQPSTQPATQPHIQLSTHPPTSPASHPALPCPAQNWQPAGVIRVSAPLARLCAKIICKHQAGTCKFIDLHLNQGPDNQIIHFHKRKRGKRREGGGPSRGIYKTHVLFLIYNTQYGKSRDTQQFYCFTKTNISL